MTTENKESFVKDMIVLVVMSVLKAWLLFSPKDREVSSEAEEEKKPPDSRWKKQS